MPTKLIPLICGVALSIGCASKKGGSASVESTPPAPRSATHEIKFASTDGRFVGLTDGTLWNIDWQDSRRASSLRSGQAVRVQRAGSGEFPYRISTADGNSVAARRGKRLD